MRELHLYLLALASVLVAGFSVGLIMAKLGVSGDDVGIEYAASLKKPNLLEFGLGVVTWGYALAWFFVFIDGAYFVWIPAVLVWLFAYTKAEKYYLLSFKEHKFHFYVILFSALAVIGGFYLVKWLQVSYPS